MKIAQIIIMLSLLIPYNVYSACIGSSPNLTAASANYSDVLDCVNVSTYGDTINIPACADGGCVWNSGIEITKDIRIIGAGKTSTYIRNNTTPPGLGRYSYIFKFTPDSTACGRLNSLTGVSAIYEVSGISFTSSSIVTYRAHLWFQNNTPTIVRRVKIHDNYFNNVSMSMGDGANMFGVIYNNTFSDARGPKCTGLDYSTLESDPMTLGDSKGWYVEDNTYTVTSGASTPMIASGTNDGGGLVVRYNTVTGKGVSGGVYAIESHGNQNSDIYAPQKTEIYGNSITATQYSLLYQGRGGKNIVMFNYHAADDASDIELNEEYSDYMTDATHPNNQCPDSHTTVQTCTDNCFCGKVHDTYIVNNRRVSTGALITAHVGMDFECREVGRAKNCTTAYGSNAADYPVVNNPAEIVENREFWQQSLSFDGTTGAGCGSLASRPATCTPGVGYWATDQSCSDLTGMVGANPRTPISGTLYKCTSPNTWTAYYTPFTYPHPLRNSTMEITPPTGVKVLN